MEAFEDELVIFEIGGFDESVVEDSDDEVVHTMRREGYGEEISGREGGKYGDENLPLSAMLN